MRSIFLALAMVSMPCGQVDIQQIVRKAIQNYGHDWREQMNWTTTRTAVTVSGDRKEIEVSEIGPLGGTPYERLIGKNGSPLSPEAESRENSKYDKALKEREKESPAEHASRLHKYESDRAFIEEIPEAYNFKLVGEEAVEGASRVGRSGDTPGRVRPVYSARSHAGTYREQAIVEKSVIFYGSLCERAGVPWLTQSRPVHSFVTGPRF